MIREKRCKQVIWTGIALLTVFLTSTVVLAKAQKTKYPVIFVHGGMGFDEIAGLDYFGNDYGVFVGDPCDSVFETSCNPHIDRYQQAVATEVNPFGNSEDRGQDLAEQIQNYMITTGAEAVNIIAHSQGGLDARKAAKELYDDYGYQVVKVLITISSPHRGMPMGKGTLERGEDGFNAIIAWEADNIISPIIYGEKGDFFACMKAIMYDDWDPEDGVVTGVKAFNEAYPMNDTIHYYASLITAVQGGLNPMLRAFGLLVPLDNDGDGWCGEVDENNALLDCDNDGAAGAGDGDFDDGDDDGFVGVNSQQMGARLTYNSHWLLGTYFSEDPTTGYVSDLNHPNEIQSTSYSSVLPEDHLDVIGLGVIPYLIKDSFDELQFYGDLIDYIAEKEND